MLRFKNYLSEEVLPTAGVKNGVIDIENTAVRGQINATLANVTAQPAVTPYIVLHRISKALSYFHIIMPKRAYLEGDKGVEVVEVKQFGHRMGMTNDGQFINDVPGRYFLFLSYRLSPSVGGGYGFGGDQLQSLGGSFKVTAKVVDEVELQSLLASAEISLAEDCDAYENQQKYKAMAPKEKMHTALGDCDCSQGDSESTKSAVDTSMRRKDKKLSAAELDEAMTRKQKVRSFMSHDPEAAERILKMGKKEREEKKSFASAKKEIKRLKEEQIDEGGMPASVIKHKQKLANMTPDELKKKFAGKSEEHLKSMARRHGYGKDSDVYSKHIKEEERPNAWGQYPKEAKETRKRLRQEKKAKAFLKAQKKVNEEQIDEASVRKLLNYKNERKHDVRATKISASHSRDMSKDPSLSHSKRKEFGDEEKWLRGKQKKMEDGIKLADAKLKGKAKVNAPLPKHPYMEETIDEKLTKAMSAGDVISDFIHSKDPKFKGKSKKMRQKMALGAYYGMHPEKSKLDEMMSRIKKTTAHRKMATSVDTQTRHALGAKKEDTKTILVTKKGDPRAAAGGGVKRIPKDKFDPSIYNRASE